jgi:hypothetical protein
MSAPLRIRPATTKTIGDQEQLKPYLDRLLKLIPAEVLSLYLVGVGIIPSEKHVVAIGWAIFCLMAVALVKAYGTSDDDTSPDWTHVCISMIAFVLWVYSLGGPFVVLKLHEPYLASLLILAFTFIAPFAYRGKSDH